MSETDNKERLAAPTGSVVAAFECDCMQHKLTVEVREMDGDAMLVLRGKDHEHILMESRCDQWGTWINIGSEALVAQEDKTRSFVDALIQALTVFKKFTDVETLPSSPLNV